MTDPRALLDAYAKRERNDYFSYETDRFDELTPAAFAALRAVLDRHYLVYDEVDRCRGCWNPFHDNYEPWPCATVRAITTALEADRG